MTVCELKEKKIADYCIRKEQIAVFFGKYFWLKQNKSVLDKFKITQIIPNRENEKDVLLSILKPVKTTKNISTDLLFIVAVRNHSSVC